MPSVTWVTVVMISACQLAGIAAEHLDGIYVHVALSHSLGDLGQLLEVYLQSIQLHLLSCSVAVLFHSFCFFRIPAASASAFAWMASASALPLAATAAASARPAALTASAACSLGESLPRILPFQPLPVSGSRRVRPPLSSVSHTARHLPSAVLRIYLLLRSSLTSASRAFSLMDTSLSFNSSSFS